MPVGEFGAVIEAIDPLLALASLALVLPMAATKAAIFRAAGAVQGLAFSFGRMLAIQLASAFYTLVVPGQLGGTVSRWYMLQKPGRQPVEAASVMLMTRLLETGTACLIGLVFALADPVARSLGVVPVLALLFVAIGGGGLLLVTGVGRRLGGGLVALLPRHRWLAPLHRSLPRLAEAARRMRRMRPGAALGMVGLTLLWHGLGLLAFWLAAMAVGANLSLVTLGWVRSLLAVVLLLPVGWGGLGVREASLVGMLQPYGVGPALAVAIGAIISVRHILEAVLGGLIELTRLWRRRQPVVPPLDAAGRAR